MQQQISALTDLGITILCLVCGWKLWAKPAERKQLNLNFAGLFFAAAVASLLGAMVHGIFPPESEDQIVKFLWTATLITVGVSGYNLWLINFQLLFGDDMIRRGRLLLRLVFGLYVLTILFWNHEFYLAILSYIPASFIILLILLMRVIRARNRYNIAGLVGFLLTFVAAYIQQAKIVIHPIYFDHNALYHVVQAIGLWGIYIFGSRISRWNM